MPDPSPQIFNDVFISIKNTFYTHVYMIRAILGCNIKCDIERPKLPTSGATNHFTTVTTYISYADSAHLYLIWYTPIFQSLNCNCV